MAKYALQLGSLIFSAICLLAAFRYGYLLATVEREADGVIRAEASESFLGYYGGMIFFSLVGASALLFRALLYWKGKRKRNIHGSI